jgi:hypothetical protein
MKHIEKFALRIADPYDPLFKYYERKLPSYESFIHQILVDESQNVLPYNQCPNYPTNPKSSNYDPNHYDTLKLG